MVVVQMFPDDPQVKLDLFLNDPKWGKAIKLTMIFLELMAKEESGIEEDSKWWARKADLESAMGMRRPSFVYKAMKAVRAWIALRSDIIDRGGNARRASWLAMNEWETASDCGSAFDDEDDDLWEFEKTEKKDSIEAVFNEWNDKIAAQGVLKNNGQGDLTWETDMTELRKLARIIGMNPMVAGSEGELKEVGSPLSSPGHPAGSEPAGLSAPVGVRSVDLKDVVDWAERSAASPPPRPEP